MVANRENLTDSATESKHIEVKGWPDMNLKKWRAWGFSVDEIYRTPRYNFLVQPTRSTLRQTNDGHPEFILDGKWFRVPERIERRLEAFAWTAYIVILLLFAAMLALVWAGAGISSMLMFLFMYILVEGFWSLSLGILTPSTRTDSVTIPWKSISRIVLVSDYNTILLTWNDYGENRGVAIRLHHETANKLYGALKDYIAEKVEVKKVDGIPLGSPPVKKR
jgi:hypothetical protein